MKTEHEQDDWQPCADGCLGWHVIETPRGQRVEACHDAGRWTVDGATYHDEATLHVERSYAELVDALAVLNHMGGDDRRGYCICPRKDGSAPDSKHATDCASARAALLNAGHLRRCGFEGCQEIAVALDPYGGADICVGHRAQLNAEQLAKKEDDHG